jgi:hypothetical protein
MFALAQLLTGFSTWSRLRRYLMKCHMKSWSTSSDDGCLDENTWHPSELTPYMTCLIVPSFPAASSLENEQ